MSRTSDQTLPYWQHEVGLYEDLKMVALNIKYGPLGESIFNRVMCAITKSNGYYVLLTDELISYVCHSVGNKWIRNLDTVSKVIQCCGACGLFDVNLLSQNVITSRGIQRRWLHAKKKSRAKGYSTAEFWLLEREGQDMPESYNNDNSCSNNADKCSNNADKCSNNSYISKVNEGKDTVVGNSDSKRGFYGIHHNVKLSDAVFKELGETITERFRDDYINRLSGFIKSKATGFRGDCAAMILKWYQQDLSGGRIASQTKKTYTSEQINAMTDSIPREEL